MHILLTVPHMNNMKQKTLISLLLLIASSTASAASADKCTRVTGRVRLDPDPACTISQQFPGNSYLGAMGACFSTTAIGGLAGRGFSGLTVEMATSPLTGGTTPIPLILNERGLNSVTDEFYLPETRRFFTARSILKLAGGDLYTADAGVIGYDGSSTEQLVIDHGTGDYTGVKGVVYLTGKPIQNWVQYTGEICRP